MFKTVLAVDMGSVNTKLATKDGVSSHLTCIALDDDGTKVVAVGENGRSIAGSAVSFPVKGGAIANMCLAGIYLKRMARELTGKKNVSCIFLHAAVPGALGAMKHNALRETAKLAGFRGVKLHNSLLVGAIGAGIDINSSKASMVVDIGKDKLSMAVVANGGVVWESIDWKASACVDRAIQGYFREKHRVIVGERVAQSIKMNLNNAVYDVDARSVSTGLPVTIKANGAEIREGIEFCMADMCEAITEAIKATPIETAADLLDNGITLIGGGALQFGISKYFSQTLHLPIRVAEAAQFCIINGLNSCVFARLNADTPRQQGAAVAVGE